VNKIDAFVERRPGLVPGTALGAGVLAFLIDVHPALDIGLWAVSALLMGACAFLDQDALNYHGTSVFREGSQELSDFGRFAQRASFVVVALIIAAVGVGETLGRF
jgi:hypothetical protein